MSAEHNIAIDYLDTLTGHVESTCPTGSSEAGKREHMAAGIRAILTNMAHRYPDMTVTAALRACMEDWHAGGGGK